MAIRTLLQRFRGQQAVAETAKIPVTPPLDEPFASTLRSMYDSEPQLGVDEKMHPIDSITRIGPQQGMLIYELVRNSQSENTLEIGLAFGFSTVYFLAAIRANGKGRHVAVDPFQYEWWHGIGITRERVLGMRPGSFEFSDESEVQALARFAREQRRFGVVFIDGDHRFDGILIGFSLAASLCEPGGHIIFDDMWMQSVQRVVSFIRLNRSDFTEVPTQVTSLAVFRKAGTDKRPWNHFVPF